jgi:hypothetical protein
MNYDHKHQLAFLLSLAALPIGGCVISDGDDDGDSGDDTGSATQNTMTADDDSGSMTSPMTADDTGTETVDDSGSSSGGSADDTAGTTGGEVPQVCSDLGAHFEKCMFKDAQERVDECVLYLVEYGYTGDCLIANEEYYACLSVAACEDFAKAPVCDAELTNAMETCAGGTGTDSGSESGSGSSTGA